MNGYPLALFVHLLSLLLAVVASSLATLAALRLRTVATVAEARSWLALVRRVVPGFPIAGVGLLASGAWMTHAEWRWSLAWIDAALVGLALIVALGNGVEATRIRAFEREFASAGLTPRARRLARDPLFWTAKATTLTLVVAVVFVMTVKPAALESAARSSWRSRPASSAPCPSGGEGGRRPRSDDRPRLP